MCTGNRRTQLRRHSNSVPSGRGQRAASLLPNETETFLKGAFLRTTDMDTLRLVWQLQKLTSKLVIGANFTTEIQVKIKSCSFLQNVMVKIKL